MLQRHSTGAVQRLSQEALAFGIRRGLLSLLPFSRLMAAGGNAQTIEDLVGDQVPGAHRVGVLLGPPRANAKPVLQVFDRAGRTVAFGKVGHNELSARLVRRETEVLTELAQHSFTSLEVPRVLYAGQWEGLEVLLLTPLLSGHRRPPSWELPLPAMHELAESAAPAAAAIDADQYLSGLRARAQETDERRGATALTEAVDALLRGSAPLRFGRWHGDWAPWNMALHDGRVRLWDWERSSAGVPLGLDIVHFLLQAQFRDGAGPEAAAEALLDRCTPALARWYGTPGEVQATVLIYLVEILQRYLADAGTAPTPRMQSRVAVLDRMISIVSRMSSSTGGLRAYS